MEVPIHLLAVWQSVRGGDRPAAGRDRGSGLGDGLRTSRFPGIEQDQGRTALMQRPEGGGLVLRVMGSVPTAVQGSFKRRSSDNLPPPSAMSGRRRPAQLRCVGHASG